MRVAALIVAYKPASAQINRLIVTLARECETVYVMDNGGGAAAIEADSLHRPVLQIVDMGGNTGLGHALNTGFALATEAGIQYVATFDQDSDPASDQVTKLVDKFTMLVSTGLKVAAIGPRIMDRRGAHPIEHPFMGRLAGWPTAVRCRTGSEYVETDFLITSGTIVSIAAYLQIGKFDAGLFVDYTDFDWCFRALRRGYRLIGICTMTMVHELSDGGAQKIFGMSILQYGPIRRYYYGRNTVILSRRAHVSLGWRARLLLGLALRVVFFPIVAGLSRGPRQEWLMMCEGIVHGALNRDGAHPSSAS